MIGCGRGSLRAHRPRGRERHRPARAARCWAELRGTARTTSATVLEWGVRALGKPGDGQRGGRPARQGDRRPLSRPTTTTAGCCSSSRRRSSPLTPRNRPMTDRRRNLFVLLVVLGPARRVAAVRRSSDQADAAGARPQGRRRARLPGASRPAAAQGHADGARPRARHHARARRPARRRRAGDPALRRGPDRGRPAGRRERRARGRSQVGTTAQLYFYDWEPNVLDADCRTEPRAGQRRPDRDHGPLQRGQAGVEVQPQIDSNNTTNGPIYYAFDKTSHRAARTTASRTSGGPISSATSGSRTRTGNAEILAVRRGHRRRPQRGPAADRPADGQGRRLVGAPATTRC